MNDTPAAAVSPKPLNTFFIGSVAAMSGLLFGFDASIAASVGGSVNSFFGLTDSPLLQGMWVAAVPLGALIGALLGGVVCDRYGRRKGLLINAVLFIIGLALSAASPAFSVYVGSRLLMGLAIGNSAVITPMYMAEVAPPESRGRILFMYQLSIVIGILVSFLVGVTVHAFIQSDDVDWRIMIAIGLIPACLFFFGMLNMPRSPRWLMEQDRHDEAREILHRMVGPDQAEKTFREIRDATGRKSAISMRACLSKTILPVMLLGFFLQFFQQTTGINADMYFGPEIFREGGFSQSASMWAQVAMGVVNLVATIVSILLVDRLGRRRLMFIGVSGLVVMLLVQAGLFMVHDVQLRDKPVPAMTCHTLPNTGAGQGGHAIYHHSPAGTSSTGQGSVEKAASDPTQAGSSKTITILIFISILMYIVCFAISAGPLCWLMISEVFPLRFRGIGMSVAVAANWLVDYFVSQLFPLMKVDLGMPGTLLIYAGFTVIGLFLAIRFLPETLGVPLEKIEENVYAGKPLRWIGQDQPGA